MKRIISPAILLIASSVFAGTTIYTDWYVQTTGTNVNAGSTTNDLPIYICTNANWNGTSIFTPNDGSTPSNFFDGTTNCWASVTLDANTNAAYVAKVVSVAAGVNGAITLSTSAKAGTAPGNAATGNSLRVGGAWSGPNTNTPASAGGFPFNFVTQSLTNSDALMPCVNFRNDSQYNTTNAITHSLAGPILFCGYSTTPRDGGKATIDGGLVYPAYIVIAVSGGNCDFSDFIFANNGSSASAANMSNISGSYGTWRRVVMHDCRRSGFVGAGANVYVECEAYNTDLAGTSSQGGFQSGSGAAYIRCIAHDNSGNGFYVHTYATYIRCISESNAGDGFYVDVGQSPWIFGCDLYNNTGSGIRISTAGGTGAYIENCNFIKNAAFGITNSVNLRTGAIVSCGFGSGTQANGSDIANVGGMRQIGNFSYAANALPWSGAASGNFTIDLTAAKAAGIGAFTETQSGYSGTVSYPDVGAAQSASTNSTAGGGTTSHAFMQ